MKQFKVGDEVLIDWEKEDYFSYYYKNKGVVCNSTYNIGVTVKGFNPYNPEYTLTIFNINALTLIKKDNTKIIEKALEKMFLHNRFSKGEIERELERYFDENIDLKVQDEQVGIDDAFIFSADGFDVTIYYIITNSKQYYITEISVEKGR